MSFLSGLADLLLIVLQAILAFVVSYATQHPVLTGLAILALLRLFGITVQTGHKGVLFVFGRVRKELEPGFHFLLPVVITARTTPVRSVTLDLPRQRITTADGLVYDARANIVYHVADPKLALTQIDNLRHGIEVVLALIVQDLLRGKTRAAVLNFKDLDAEFNARAEASLGRWGVTLEQAGFQSIAPTRKTLRLTQLAALGGERARVLHDLMAQGISVTAALALLGADRRLVGRATARYHALQRAARLAPAAQEAPPARTLLPGVEPPVAQKPPQPAEPVKPQTRRVESVLPPEREPLQAPSRPKTTTKGVQPRSWLRLQRRIRRTVHNQGCRALQVGGHSSLTVRPF